MPAVTAESGDERIRPQFSLAFREKILGITLISPSIILFLVLIAYPFVLSIVLSLSRTNTLTLKPTFIGFENYIRLLSDPEFWISFKTTLIWTICVLGHQATVAVGK